jgi:hypothetical protein
VYEKNLQKKGGNVFLAAVVNQSSHMAWISRNKLKSKLRPKSEILLKFEKSKKNAFLEKGLAQILAQLEKKLKLPPINIMYFRDNFNITNIWWSKQYSMSFTKH